MKYIRYAAVYLFMGLFALLLIGSCKIIGEDRVFHWLGFDDTDNDYNR